MASELTAAELAELKEKVKADKHGWSSIRAEWLSALIAAAERVEAAERQKRIACGVADKLGERLRASNARATAAEARVGQLIEALIASHTDIGHWLQLARYQREKMDQNLGWCPTEGGIVRSEMVRSQISTALLNADLARTALKPQEPHP